ncbi:hypothetical protein SAMN04488107_0579 [Geodermatophilus saharensis]|uniref:EF-hand domain-containing protein n=1 Tax=Geodermatophilus saharensis TaxID=1137994 RepID=A0A239A5N2_9ACTN|nr:hypothetical protein [Geodermatophilus saharensis]SNR90976.1 hypothetical protein SAMN04488107_0579 [Geodermatophilus saharensis]
MRRTTAVVSIAVPVAALLVGGTGAASAAPPTAAVVLPIELETPLPAMETLPECLDPDVGSQPGPQTGTETLRGQIVVTGSTFTFRGTNTLEYTVDLGDTVVTGTAVEHITFHAAGGGRTVQTTTIQERRAVVDGDGDADTVTIRAVSHVTYVDADGDGVPDPGEFSSLVDRFSVRCG